MLLFLLSFILEEFEELSVLFLSVVEYEPLLNPSALFELVESVLVPEEELLDELSAESELAFEPLLPLEKSPDLNPSALFELVESLVVLVEDLLDEPLTEPELKPLVDFELLELDLLLKPDLLPLDLAKAVVLSDGLIPTYDKTSNGKLENAKINVKSRVKTYFFLILLIVITPLRLCIYYIKKICYTQYGKVTKKD